MVRPRMPRSAVAGLLALALAGAAGAADPPDAQPASRDSRHRPGAEPGGRLEGSIVVGRRLSSKKIRFNLYADVAPPMAAASPVPERSEVENVVVYFEASPSLPPPRLPSTQPVMRQAGLTFVPHVLAVPRGSTVEFPNGDAIFHNVFSLSRAASFDLGRYPNGASKSFRFDTPGVVKVFCHIHSDMSGVIFVLDNGFFAVPDARGRYAIDGIPPGEYRVTAWHERARPLGRTVRIRSGTTTEADFTIPLSDESSAGGDAGR